MELRVLNYFLMVSQEENITKAAQLLHVTQPTLSRQLMQLEDELGVKLFERSNHSIVLTSDGLLLKRRAQEIVSLAEKTKGELTTEKELSGEIEIGSGEFKSFSLLADVIAAFSAKHPGYLDLYIIHRFDYGTPIEETMEALHGLVKAGKVRALGASAMYGYQFYNMQLAARDNGWTPFVSMQDHYNLIYREDERELIPLCKQMNVALTPYSPLAAGRLCRTEWHTDTKRSKTDYMAAGKYDKNEEADKRIVLRVKELADKYEKTMTQIALAWQFGKGVTAPIIGATKAKYFDDAAGALAFELTEEDKAYLEELYVPHQIVGALSDTH